MNYKIVEKPAFDVVGKSKKFMHDEFFEKGSKFWKEYVSTDAYKKLWGLTNGGCGLVTQTPLMSVYLPEDGSRDTFVDILGVEKMAEMDVEEFEVFHIPAATYAEFHCAYQGSMKMNKYIYAEWFVSTGYERDEDKPDIAAYFPMPFGAMKDMGVRWWIPVIKK